MIVRMSLVTSEDQSDGDVGRVTNAPPLGAAGRDVVDAGLAELAGYFRHFVTRGAGASGSDSFPYAASAGCPATLRCSPWRPAEAVSMPFARLGAAAIPSAARSSPRPLIWASFSAFDASLPSRGSGR